MNKELNNFSKNLNDTITVEEVMSDFLDSVSKIYLNSMMLKGCMALYIHSNYNKTQLRKTRDLDFNFFTIDDWEDFCSNSPLLASKYSKLGFNYEITYRRGFTKNPNGDSIKFKATRGDLLIEFKIDMNIGTKQFSQLDTSLTRNPINLYNIYGILADKLYVATTKKLCRRIKDLIDIWYISSKFDVDFSILVRTIRELYGNEIKENFNPCFLLDLKNYEFLKHAYDSYDLGDVKKVDFSEVYSLSVSFSSPVFEYLADGRLLYDFWNKGDKLWLR